MRLRGLAAVTGAGSKTGLGLGGRAGLRALLVMSTRGLGDGAERVTRAASAAARNRVAWHFLACTPQVPVAVCLQQLLVLPLLLQHLDNDVYADLPCNSLGAVLPLFLQTVAHPVMPPSFLLAA